MSLLQGGERSEGPRERRVYGFLEAVSRPEEGRRYARMDLVLDAVDADGFDSGDAADRAPEYLSIVRIMTTPKRLSTLFSIDDDLTEGSWFLVHLASQPGQPRAWILDATADYGGPVIRTNVVGIEPIDIPPPSPVPPAKAARLNELLAWCSVQISRDVPEPMEFTASASSQLHVRVLDVGHASCSAIHFSEWPDPDSGIIGYYDAGGPVFFHHRTFPKIFDEQRRIPRDGFVVLSHWDFDHYSLAATKLKGLQSLRWYAPDQKVGPNAARLQVTLGHRLTLMNANLVGICPGVQAWKGTASPSDRNNSGYVLRLMGQVGAILLTGDVGYDHIPGHAKADLSSLAITHHGGAGCGNPPAPFRIGNAAVSYGKPNRYGHPSSTDIRVHQTLGWTVKATAGDIAVRRGDVWLP